MKIKDVLLKSWKKPTALTGVLRPFSHVYRGAFSLRKLAFEQGVLDSYRAPVPVIVVGNLTVGGTGKTPLVVHMVEALRKHGWSPGVISRGYAGAAPSYPLIVDAATDVAHSGDEPALIVRRTGVPMAVGADRKASIELLLSNHVIDVIVSDDGLQHLALERDIEVCLIDDAAEHENENLLPAGPYREPLTRLMSVDFIVRHGGRVGNASNQFAMQLKASKPNAVSAENTRKFNPNVAMHAVAGIGNPQRFFDTCESLGYKITPHPYPDHHDFEQDDIDFDEAQVIMTEKDAVKCVGIADNRHWYLPVDADIDASFVRAVAQRLDQLKKTSLD